jgi:hypothetical protein
VIYAIRAVGTEYIKFGYVRGSVERRLGHLQTGCPLSLEVVATCQGDRQTETWIHWRLFKAKAHHRGEWFKDCDEVKKILFEMLAEDVKPEGVPSSQLHITNKRLKNVIDLASRKAGGWR